MTNGKFHLKIWQSLSQGRGIYLFSLRDYRNVQSKKIYPSKAADKLIQQLEKIIEAVVEYIQKRP